MANTLIQIKRSTTTAIPPNSSLQDGELAYSYSANVAYIGNSDDTGVVPIGGYQYVVKTNTAYDIASAAFAKANLGNIIASLAFDKANSANLLAYNTGIGANAFAAATIAGANAAVGAGANSYAAAAAVGANNYSDSTFVKLISPNQTITGNVAITGRLVVSGNVQFQDSESLRISDPLIYLAGNNYSSDIVDIGFIANYVNATGSNVHTGLYREHTNKEYYLFQGYDKEPINNHIGAFSNNMTLAVLNADLKTSNLVLGSTNAIPWITSAYDTANAAFNKANSSALYAFSTVIANGVSLVADSNTDTLTITQSNGIIITGNAGADSFDISLSQTGVSASSYGGADRVGTFTVDAYGRLTSAGNVNIAIDAAAITSGILSVPRGGTGVNTFANNGIVFGNTTSGLRVTAAGTEGQVLQASSQGTPVFAMLDGGAF